MNAEILRLVDTIHRDKDIDKEVIFQGIEAAFLSAMKKKLGESGAAQVVIDRTTGETTALDEAGNPVVVDDLGRIAAMTGKQVLFQRIREAERDKIYSEYEDKVGKLVNGVVQRIEGPNLIISLGKVEGILPRGEQSPGERFRVGERIKLIVKDLKKNTNRVKVTLSRASPLLVRALFELEVPEIAEKVIEIVDLVREPGYRTKIAVTTYDHNVDCVGACVGVRGSRIKNIVDELFGEKIDIVRWNDSIEVLIMNALKPAEITSMDLDYEAKKAIVYVKPEQQSLAIGKRGQNVRLASKLAKWELDIVTVSDEDVEKLRKEGSPQALPPTARSAAQEDGGEAAVAEAPAEGVEAAPPPAEGSALGAEQEAPSAGEGESAEGATSDEPPPEEPAAEASGLPEDTGEPPVPAVEEQAETGAEEEEAAGGEAQERSAGAS